MLLDIDCEALDAVIHVGVFRSAARFAATMLVVLLLVIVFP
ncbi:MAG TPA: hypothetical protein VMW57_05570 [Methyloceanibacter sp.]|nr:hypothetical protein [Methyloceanibacter sp.]